jgi:transcriptional regulator with XRE-family HTH domain
MENKVATPDEPDALDSRLAQRLAALRTERNWSLDELAQATGISRATLSRLERGETSPTASLLGKLCSAYGLTMSRLLAELEQQGAKLIPLKSQQVWVDPETGFRRRLVSPPSRDFRMEMLEGSLPPGAVITYDEAPVRGMEQHMGSNTACTPATACAFTCSARRAFPVPGRMPPVTLSLSANYDQRSSCFSRCPSRYCRSRCRRPGPASRCIG